MKTLLKCLLYTSMVLTGTLLCICIMIFAWSFTADANAQLKHNAVKIKYLEVSAGLLCLYLAIELFLTFRMWAAIRDKAHGRINKYIKIFILLYVLEMASGIYQETVEPSKGFWWSTAIGSGIFFAFVWYVDKYKNLCIKA